MSRYAILWLVLAALIVTTALAVVLRNGDSPEYAGQRSRTYENPVYSYSFEYPSDIAVVQYAPEHVTIGRPTDDGFQSFVNAEVVSERGNRPSYDFSLFAAEKARSLCAADSPRVTIDCGEADQVSSFVSSRGAAGIEFYLTLVRRDLTTGRSTSSAFGPVYAFEVSSRDSSGLSAALLVYVPLSSLGIERMPISVEGVARSVSLGR